MAHDDEAAIQTDAYIDALLARHGELAGVMPEPQRLPPELRRAVELLETALPRLHPSFLFEERLAARLRAAAMAGRPAGGPPVGEVIPLRTQVAVVSDAMPAAIVDRRLLLGGAIASGATLAGAAMLAWRFSRDRARTRRSWLA